MVVVLVFPTLSVATTMNWSAPYANVYAAPLAQLTKSVPPVEHWNVAGSFACHFGE